MSDILIAGCGALGSRIAIELVDWEMVLLDDDVVGQENIPTSAYSVQHIGAPKSMCLSDMVCLRGGEARFAVMEISQAQHVLRYAPRLVIDCLDNIPSRLLLCGLPIPTLHVGVGAEGWGSCIWDRGYALRENGNARGQNPVCTHELGRPILRATATRAVEIIERFMYTGFMENAAVQALSYRYDDLAS